MAKKKEPTPKDARAQQQDAFLEARRAEQERIAREGLPTGQRRVHPPE